MVTRPWKILGVTVPLALASLLIFVIACGGTAEPQIIEKEVVVEKEVIKEVPVEKEVIREVEKQVVVEKEVPKEVIKEVIIEKEVPKEVVREVVVVATAAPAPTAQPQIPGEFGGIFIKGEGRLLSGFEPTDNTCVCHLTVVNGVFSQVMFTDSQTFEVKGEMATAWNASPDGKTWTFKLRDDVKFHDGSPLTAEDVEYSMYRWMERPNKVTATRNAGVRFTVDSYRAVDPTTFEVTLKDPDVGFMPAFGNAFAGVVPKHIFKPADDEDRPLTIEDWKGAGPFMAKEFRKDEFFETERNPDYFVENRPFLDGVRVFRMDSVSTQQAAIRTNRITMSSFFPGWTKTESDEIKAQLGEDVVVQSSTPAIFYFLQFNINKAPWDDVNMRRAVHLAIDRQKMIDLVVQGAGEISPWYHWAWDWIVPLEEIKTWEGFNPDTKEQDIAEAAQIVSDYTGGERLKANLMCRTIDVYCDQAEIIVEDLKKIGIDVTLESFEPNAGIQKWRRGDFEMIGGQRTAMAYDDPEAYNAAFYLPGAGNNGVGWENEEFVALWNQEKQITDQVERGKILRQMVEILREELPDVPLIEPAQFIVWRSDFKGWKIFQTANSYSPMRDVWFTK